MTIKGLKANVEEVTTEFVKGDITREAATAMVESLFFQYEQTIRLHGGVTDLALEDAPKSTLGCM